MANTNSYILYTQPTTVWQSLVKKCLPPQSRDAEFWWQITGYQLAKLLDAAEYPIERQYEILLFHFHWIVPRLGPAPEADGRPKWKSTMTQDSTPAEFSWQWNTATSPPEIRYSWEAFNPGADSCLNPLNHALSLEYMRDVSRVAPDTDFTWSRHFLQAIDKQGDRPGSHVLHAVDHHRSKGLSLKSYLVWRDAGLASTQHEWDEAITELDPNNASYHTVKEFLAHNPEGKLLSPMVIGWDNVRPSQSRLKWYMVSQNTTFSSLREIMTIGGLLNIPEDRLQDLRSLITTVLELPHDYPEDSRVPSKPQVREKWAGHNPPECFAYYFDVAPGRKPDVKFYLPTQTFGTDDLTTASRLVEWMKARGRGAYCDRYLSMVHTLTEYRGLKNGKGLHSYISYQFTENGVPDIKSYLTPEAFHSARFPNAEPSLE